MVWASRPPERRLPLIELGAARARWHVGALAEGKPLPKWHPLLTGASDSVVTAGVSIADRTISEQAAKLDDLEAEIIDWVEI